MVKRQGGINGLDRLINTDYYAKAVSDAELKNNDSINWLSNVRILDKLGTSTWKKVSTINNGYPILINIDQSKQ